MRIKLKIKQLILSSFVILLVVGSFWVGLNLRSTQTTTPEQDLDKTYRHAIEDAVFADESEIYNNLTPIVESNTNLRWENGRVLVVVWTKYYNSYPAGEIVTTWWGDIWVTVVPEIKEWVAEHPISDNGLTLRLEQLLGLPKDSGDMWFAEVWVKPEDLFRPTPDPEITDNVAQLDFPDGVTQEHIDWFNNNIIFSYFQEKKYPWTRLGYTYDWGNPNSEIGLSEFVIRENSEIMVEAITPTNEYFK